MAPVIDERYVPLTKEHIKDALDLYYKWMSRFNIYTDYNETTFKQHFMENEFVKTYAILDKNTGNIIDFASFYILDYFI